MSRDRPHGAREPLITATPATLDATPLLRWARAGVLAAVALVAGAVAHVAAEGRLPHPLLLAALLGATTVAAAGFLRRRAGTGRLVALVVAGQALTHLALSTLSGHRGDPAAATAPPGTDPLADSLAAAPAGRTGSLMDQYVAARDGAASLPATRGPDPLGWLTHQVDHVTEQGPAMVVAHLLAAVALGLWLAVGEGALWRLLHLAAALVQVAARRHLVALAALAARHGTGLVLLARPRPPAVLRPLADQLAGDVASRRGPPALLAA